MISSAISGKEISPRAFRERDVLTNPHAHKVSLYPRHSCFFQAKHLAVCRHDRRSDVRESATSSYFVDPEESTTFKSLK